MTSALGQYFSLRLSSTWVLWKSLFLLQVSHKYHQVQVKTTNKIIKHYKKGQIGTLSLYPIPLPTISLLRTQVATVMLTPPIPLPSKNNYLFGSQFQAFAFPLIKLQIPKSFYHSPCLSISSIKQMGTNSFDLHIYKTHWRHFYTFPLDQSELTRHEKVD